MFEIALMQVDRKPIAIAAHDCGCVVVPPVRLWVKPFPGARIDGKIDDPIDTVEMILVTVIGLCVGLDFPIMAILIAAVSWILIWVAGRHLPIEIRLQADSSEKLETGLKQVRHVARNQGWKEAFAHRSHSKNTARLILLHQSAIGEEDVEAALLKGLEGAEVTWKVGE